MNHVVASGNDFSVSIHGDCAEWNADRFFDLLELRRRHFICCAVVSHSFAPSDLGPHVDIVNDVDELHVTFGSRFFDMDRTRRFGAKLGFLIVAGDCRIDSRKVFN